MYPVLRIAADRALRQVQFWVLALLIGIAAGFAALGFRLGISGVQRALYGADDLTLASVARDLPWAWVLVVPVLGGLVVGLILDRFTPDGRVRAVADVMVVAVNPISRATYATLFEPHGVVVVAADPAEALASPAPARLLIDTTALGASTMMPDRVRELVDAIGDGRVLLLCAAGDERQAGWLAAGATVVERPIAKAELVRRVFTLSPNLVLKVGEGDKDVSKDMVMDVAGLRLARS